MVLRARVRIIGVEKYTQYMLHLKIEVTACNDHDRCTKQPEREVDEGHTATINRIYYNSKF